jgi:hypothetical protein
MTYEYTFYDELTGMITGATSSTTEPTEVEIGGRPFIHGLFDPQEYYVASGIAALRPPMPCKLTGKTLTDIPVGATLRINQTPYIVNDGVAVLSSDQPAKLTVSVYKPPYKPFVTEVDFGS